MYEQDCGYTNIDEETKERIKKILDDLKKLGMVEYLDKERVRIYPPNEDTYAE